MGGFIIYIYIKTHFINPTRKNIEQMRILFFIAFLAFAASASGQSKQEAAQTVMKNARATCAFKETKIELTVTCPDSLPRESRLAFATAIANADALLLGSTRQINFRLKSGEPFAEASPKFGIREVIKPLKQKKSSQDKSSKIVIGTLADTVLEIRGKGTSVKQVGRDNNGLLVEWHYPDVTYLMARRPQNGVEAYRIIKISPQP
ncbi:MAG: hypothetical protein KGN35_02005 [Betaproteobacteria bacterium]|nr:hypothetical protein [Betaproteobacteria bacterium]